MECSHRAGACVVWYTTTPGITALDNYATFVQAYEFPAGPEHSTRRPSLSGLVPPKDCLVPYVGCCSTECKKGTGIRSHFSRIRSIAPSCVAYGGVIVTTIWNGARK